MKKLPTCCYLCGKSAPGSPGADWVLDGWSKWMVCPECLREGRALKADTDQQNCGLGGPIDAFWDQTRTCGTCAKDYVFSGEEQRFWYETLKFYVDSVPVQCPDCRREARARKRAQKTLQTLLPLSPRADWRQCEQAARAAALVGGSKAIEYWRRAKNLCDDPDERLRLEAEIAAFKPLPALQVRRDRLLVEQLELHYRREPATNILSDDDRISILKAPGFPKSKSKLVARIEGMWVRPEPDRQDRRQLAYLHGENICPNMPPHTPRVLIDTETGVLIYLPHSGTRGQTGHHRHGNKIFGPPGPLPWI